MTLQSCQSLFGRHTVTSALVALLSLSGAIETATAQTPTAAPGVTPGVTPGGVPSTAPPQLERLEEGAPVGIRQAPNNPRSVTESRDRSGAVSEIEVRTGVSTYYLRPNGQVGNAQPGDQQSSGNRAAQFRVTEFDLGQPSAAEPGDATQAVEETAKPPLLPTKK